MNFFEQQHRARRRTGLLVAYFCLAVVLIILSINTLVFLGTYGLAGVGYAGEPAVAAAPLPERLRLFLQEPWWVVVTCSVVLLITLRSVVSLLHLGTGGEAVARMVDARRIDMGSEDPGERRLINVVEEMSIASGTPVPTLYVMDEEQGINAFVAGYDADEAVLVVTAGALEVLDRDELQGVVGHEYSHILNGDMRLNVHLISVLAGVLALGQVGGFLLRSMGRSRGGGRSGGQAVAIIFGIGITLFVIGYLGLFFGRLIKAAVSRQREFLADASSVQFTRNPHGIASALWKISRHSSGARLQNLHAEDMSHMCFGDSMRYSFAGLFATHPPLDVRINAIDPNFARQVRAEAAQDGADVAAREQGRAAAAPPGGAAAAGFAGGAAVRTSTRAITDSVGNPTPAHVAYASQLHAAIPPGVLRAVHRPPQAPAVIYALLLAHMAAADRPVGVELIERTHNRALADLALHLAGELDGRGAGLRLPLLDLALPAIKDSSPGERKRLVATCTALGKVDAQVSLFEFALVTLTAQYLDPSADDAQVEYTRFEDVEAELASLFGALAHTAGADPRACLAAYRRGVDGFGLQGLAEPPGPTDVEALRAALGRLRGLSPFLKRSVINACADCVLEDGTVTAEEAELLRAIAATLGCPMPPLLQEV